MSAATISVDEFLALEQKVLQTVELIHKEREARAAAESQVIELRGELTAVKERLSAASEKLAAAEEKLASAEEKLNTASAAQTEIESLHRERAAVKLRVEKMLSTMDSLF
jgi:predicted  nucleic acid-binding Zn-ribbon protein